MTRWTLSRPPPGKPVGFEHGLLPGVNLSGAACFHPEQLSIKDENLVPTSEPEEDHDYRFEDGNQGEDATGLIITRDAFTDSCRYAEARMFFPRNGGQLRDWPAFWHTGFDRPLTGKLDVAEGLSGGALCSMDHHHGTSGEHLRERGVC